MLSNISKLACILLFLSEIVQLGVDCSTML